MSTRNISLLSVYLKMIESSLKEQRTSTSESKLIYFTSYYINRFSYADMNMKAYIGFKKQDVVKDVFILTVPIKKIKNKETKDFFDAYFEEGIKPNDRYIGLIKTSHEVGFIFQHDDELLNAYKSGQFSKISEAKKNKMRKFKMSYVNFDTLDLGIKILGKNIKPYYGYSNPSVSKDGKRYLLRPKDIIRYELFKMIYPEIFYPVLAEQFNVKIEYLKKNQVQLLPKPDLEKDYMVLTENDEVYWFNEQKA